MYDAQSPEQWVLDYISLCPLIGIDFQELDDVKTREALFHDWGFWSGQSDGLLRTFLDWDGQDIPSTVVDRVLKCAGAMVNSVTTTISNGTERGTSTNIGFATFWLVLNLTKASESGALHRSAGDGHAFAYRGYFVDQNLWATLKFLDTIISNDIDAHPDSIFGTYRGWTVYYWFWWYGFQEVWNDILEEHGFDPGWVWEEEKRRMNPASANATGHDAEVETSASQALEVKKRRAYAADDDA